MKQNNLLLRVVMILLLFGVIVALLLVANFVTSLEDNTYLSVFKRLRPSFYLRTAVILLFSSMVYVPLSYGISYYFIQSRSKAVGIRDLFYIFYRVPLLLKAVLLRMIMWLTQGVFRLLVLILGLFAEGLLWLSRLTQLDMWWQYSLRELFEKLSLLPRPTGILWLSFLVWVAVLFVMLMLYVRFMFCKYALLCYNELSSIEAYRVGLCSTKGKMVHILRQLLKIYSYYIIWAVSFGRAKLLQKMDKQTFSDFAVAYVSEGRVSYFRAKAEKSA